MPKGGARGQNLGHLKISFIFFCFIFLLCNQSYLKNRYYIRVDFLPVTSESRWGFFAFELDCTKCKRAIVVTPVVRVPVPLC